MRRVIVCGPPHSGKSVFLANLMRLLPPDSFYLAFAAPDGEWHWSNFGDQDLVAAVRQKGKFTENFVGSMVEAIRANEQPLVLVDTGGVRSEANERIFDVCDACIILSSKSDEIVAWREFAAAHNVTVLAELDSVLHGTCELYADRGDHVVRGRISGLERGQTVQSVTLNAVVARLRVVIQGNSEITNGELVANINVASLLTRLGVDDTHDPFLGVRPAHLRPALVLARAAMKLDVVRVYNARAAILASAYAARLPGSVELYDVSKGYIKIPDVTPEGSGFCPGVEWEVLALPDFTLVKWKNQRFITADDLLQLVPPCVETTRPVVVANDGPPMWIHATLARAYVRAGCPWVGQFWPVESGRAQPSLGGQQWDEAHPFAGPAVIVAGPDEKIGDIFPVSFDLLRWDAPILGRLASGELVVDVANSHVATHGSVLPFLADALAMMSSDDQEVVISELDMGRVVGESIRVATTDTDEIVYAQRPNRRGLTRFVKNRKPDPCSRVVVLVKRTTGGAYVLLTAFIGTRCPAEPWDRNADKTSVPFWNKNALIWGAEEVIPGTETTKCPW